LLILFLEGKIKEEAMIISKLYVKAFKSIVELEVSFDPQITVLIGPNEGGKTNILRALEIFNLNMPFTKEMTCQYSNYYEQNKYPEITLEYSNIESKLRGKLATLHADLKDAKSFRVKKCGPNANDYWLLIGDQEVPLSDPVKFFNIVPRALYFDNIPLIKSTVRLSELLAADTSAQAARDMLRIGGVSEYQEIFEDSTRGRRRREEVSRFLTEQIREIWTQDPSIMIKLNVNADILHIDISDETTVFDTTESRSLGFWWFLSFYVNFMTQTIDNGRHQYVHLIEEPGIHLHPAGQKDLVRLLEILSQRYQIIYTSHSPFMINRAHPERVRLVSKNRHGTEVDDRAYRENWKPLRSSIGMMIGDLLFFGDSGILLEVPTKKIPFVERMKKLRIWHEEEAESQN